MNSNGSRVLSIFGDTMLLTASKAALLWATSATETMQGFATLLAGVPWLDAGELEALCAGLETSRGSSREVSIRSF